LFYLEADALAKAGCDWRYREVAGGASRDRPNLRHCWPPLRAGDVLVVWTLDRFGCSLKQRPRLVRLFAAINSTRTE